MARGLRFTEEQLAAYQKRPVEKSAPKKNKYHAVKANGFHSRLENRRARELMALAAAGAITDLEFQVKYELIPAQRDAAGKVIERACTYTCDARYRERGELVVEDSKSVATKTQQYRIRRKLMLWLHGIRIMEV